MGTTLKPVVCKLTTPELQNRKSTVIAALKAIVIERNELPTGYSYTFEASDENLDLLADFVKTERICCDFLSFQITIEDNIARLTMTGPEGAKEFLMKEVDL